jgi:hypothetical protein
VNQARTVIGSGYCWMTYITGDAGDEDKLGHIEISRSNIG